MAQESRTLVAELKNEVSSYKSKLKQAEDLASTDELTGVANRRGIESFILSNIDKSALFTVVMFDLNEFKGINDTFGHIAGDEILKQFAKGLRSCTRDQDLVGRLGGDEFIAVMTCGESRARSMLGKIRDNVFTRYMLRDDKGNFLSSIQVNASVGVAEWQAGETIQQVIARADAAMYMNKEAASALVAPAR
jgi:diguanylate cyclase (GGDEF)-like protein